MARATVYALFTAFVLWQAHAISLQDAKDSVSHLFSSTKRPSSLTSQSPDSSPYFICTQDGTFPNMDSCSSYIHCSNGQTHHRDCPKNSHYSVATQKCESKCEAHCDQSLACQCGWSSCAMTPPISPVTYTPQSMEQFSCDRDGVYGTMRQCNTFIHCSNGTPYIKECPAGLHFSKETQRCELPCYAKCDHSLACTCKWSTCKEDACFLPQKIGSCGAQVTRWFYDQRTSRCSLFKYSGCGGNENNFATQQECERNCGHVDDCYMPKVEGLCHGRIPRYYFNPSEGRCLKFTYGGCQGNKNNFKSKKACEQRCITREGVSDPPVTESQPPVTEQDAEDRPQPDCSSPPETGLCKARIPRYYYDEKTGKCKKFTYGGCGGNGNNYITERQCYRMCKPPPNSAQPPVIRGEPPVTEDQPPVTEVQPPFTREQPPVTEDSRMKNEENICRLEKDEGQCQAYKRMYFFNFQNGQCEIFIYGGCSGNENRFKTLEECERTCLRINEAEPPVTEVQPPVTEDQPPVTRVQPSMSEPDCSSPPDKGPCSGTVLHHFFIRYYYDAKEGQCKMFRYGGCKGNRNNYMTEKECKRSCKPENYAEENMCRLEKDKGPCHGYLARYYFNSGAGRCEKFVYGGCKGNQNNFKTLRECERSCLRKDAAEPPVTEVQPPFTEEQPPVTEVQPPFTEEQPPVTEVQPPFTEEQILEDWPEPDCSSPPEKGPCGGSFSSFFYDEKDGECKTFTYGGCKGNRNNYVTESQCKRNCKPAEMVAEKIYDETEEPALIINCREPAIRGPCDGDFIKWYYDIQAHTCLTFIYGGCQGNSNKFDTREECEKVCKYTEAEPPVTEVQPPVTEDQPPVTEVQPMVTEPDCSSPPEKGPCLASFTRYYYDAEKKECKTFVYGGCRGNRNNYITESQCKRNCQPEEINMKAARKSQPASKTRELRQGEGFHCPQLYGKFAIPNRPQYYFECKDGLAFLYKCPTGQVLDNHQQKCVAKMSR